MRSNERITKVYVFKEMDRAFILFSNAQTTGAEEGLAVLFNELRMKFGR